MKTIIALRGIANVGKSQTIQNTYRIMKNQNMVLDTLTEEIGRVDIKAIAITNNEIKIGIESQGDPSARLEKSLNEFKQNGCKIILCATRSRGKTVEIVKALNSDYDIKWENKNKSMATDERIDNERIANKLVSLIKNALLGSTG